ncbi:MAG: hypothetical protein OXG84_07540 [Chloroflexi bacterium]|nr:hypothetical protein [Chloroflexota bacterium]
MDPVERKTPTKAIEDDSEFASALDDDEPTTEELIEMLRESLEDVKAGRTRPAREVMRELREMLAADADYSRDR